MSEGAKPGSKKGRKEGRKSARGKLSNLLAVRKEGRAKEEQGQKSEHTVA